MADRVVLAYSSGLDTSVAIGCFVDLWGLPPTMAAARDLRTGRRVA